MKNSWSFNSQRNPDCERTFFYLLIYFFYLLIYILKKNCNICTYAFNPPTHVGWLHEILGWSLLPKVRLCRAGGAVLMSARWEDHWHGEAQLCCDSWIEEDDPHISFLPLRLITTNQLQFLTFNFFYIRVVCLTWYDSILSQEVCSEPCWRAWPLWDSFLICQLK